MTQEMLLFFVVLGATVLLFVTEWLRVDVVALLVLVTLGWLGLVSPQEAISGLASNAVVSIIGVIILGHGIDRTGVMARLTGPVVRVAGGSERRLLALVSLCVGLLSAFMQNIGAAALFLPAVLRISARLDLAASRVLMPMGFSAILGGTLSMVASGPLILLNDLLRQSGEAPYGLFAVTPIGLALVLGGLLYFLLLGPVVLPRRRGERQQRDPQRQLIETWGLPTNVSCVRVPAKSPLAGRTLDATRPWLDYRVNVLVVQEGQERQYAPWRQTRFAAGQQLALLGQPSDVDRFAREQGLEPCDDASLAEQIAAGDVGGFAEVVVRPKARITGQRLRDVALRKRFGVEPVLLLSGDRAAQRDFSEQPLMPGDTLVVHGPWRRILALGDDPSFVLLTPVQDGAPARGKGLWAMLCFLGAIGLAVAGFPLSLSLLSGALAMVVLGVLRMDQAYRAVDWRTVFLLAGLIPLGKAMDNTKAAAWIATRATSLLVGRHPLLLLSAVGLMATLFSLFMSNVAATVLLVPLVAQLGRRAQLAPRALGLLVAVCASNSFLLPTHQVNALLMSPGGYRNVDYLRAGSGMTLLFLAIAVGGIYLLYLG